MTVMSKLYGLSLKKLLKVAKSKTYAKGYRSAAMCVYRAKVSAAIIAKGGALSWVGA